MMLRSLFLVMSLSCIAAPATLSLAASPAAAPNAAKEVIRYRLTNWRVVHAHNAEQGKKLAATLTQLKCEVKEANHGNHIDVRYRCRKWQELQLKDHATAHQWETWLKKYGFETVHQH